MRNGVLAGEFDVLALEVGAQEGGRPVDRAAERVEQFGAVDPVAEAGGEAEQAVHPAEAAGVLAGAELPGRVADGVEAVAGEAALVHLDGVEPLAAGGFHGVAPESLDHSDDLCHGRTA